MRIMEDLVFDWVNPGYKWQGRIDGEIGGASQLSIFGE
jgi:hypothetical protein